MYARDAVRVLRLAGCDELVVRTRRVFVPRTAADPIADFFRNRPTCRVRPRPRAMTSTPVAPRTTLPPRLDVDQLLADDRRLAMLPAPSARSRRGLEDLARVAAAVLDADAASLVIVHVAHQEPVAVHGRPPSPACRSGLCADTVALGVPLMLGDLLEDRVAACHPATADGVRAFAGHPILLTGERVGALCVTCTRPRAWTIGDAQRLRDLAELASHLLADAPTVASAAQRAERRSARPAPVRRLHRMGTELPQAC